jgi:hypothetical protein
MPAEIAKHPIWTGVATGVITFVLTAIATIFLFGRQIGSLRQELDDLVAWKKEAAPAITRIDRSGSLSFENFKTTYDAEQSKQYRRLEKLEESASHEESQNLRIYRIERKVGIDGNSDKTP